jgi:glycylpeptide N-tetradecanoyltransferase
MVDKVSGRSDNATGNNIPEEVVDKVMDQLKIEHPEEAQNLTPTELRKTLAALKLMDVIQGKSDLGGKNSKDLGEHKVCCTNLLCVHIQSAIISPVLENTTCTPNRYECLVYRMKFLPLKQFLCQGEAPPAEDGPIEPPKSWGEIRQEADPLPKDFEWCTVDLAIPEQVSRLINSFNPPLKHYRSPKRFMNYYRAITSKTVTRPSDSSTPPSSSIGEPLRAPSARNHQV